MVSIKIITDKPAQLCIISKDAVSRGPFLYIKNLQDIKKENLVKNVQYKASIPPSFNVSIDNGIGKNFKYWLSKPFYLYKNGKRIKKILFEKEDHYINEVTYPAVLNSNLKTSTENTTKPPYIAYTKRVNSLKSFPFDAKQLTENIIYFVKNHDRSIYRQLLPETNIEVELILVGDIDSDNLNEAFVYINKIDKYGFKNPQIYYIFDLIDNKIDRIKYRSFIQNKSDLKEYYCSVIDLNNDGIFEVIHYSGPYWQISYKFYSIINGELKELVDVFVEVVS